MIPLIDKRETGINLRRMMDKQGLTVNQVKQHLGLGSVQSVYHWLNGLSLPTIDNLYALSELLQVPIDAIICGNRAPIVPRYSFGKHDLRSRRLYTYYKKINERTVA